MIRKVISHPLMIKLLSENIKEKFSKHQLYARANVLIWTLRCCKQEEADDRQM